MMGLILMMCPTKGQMNDNFRMLFTNSLGQNFRPKSTNNRFKLAVAIYIIIS